MKNPHSHASHQGSTPRTVTLILVLLLYLFTVSVDGVRKVGDLPASLVGVVYLIVGCIYLVLLPGMRNRVGRVPRYLPVWLALLVLWCFTEALVRQVPVSMALLGCASYAFFVPLFYIGAELMTTDRGAVRTLRCVTLIGGVLGLGAILSAVLGPSAPPVLQPIDPSVGIHTFGAGNIYLAPSVFATGEEAAEELLIALFAWAALTSLPEGRLGRASSASLATLITVGLFAAERRADIVVAILGMATLLILGRPASHEEASKFILTATPRARSATVFALAPAVIGSAALISFLGTSKLVPFLTSASNGVNAIALIFSPVHVYVLTGQGTGTSTQGIGVLGVQAITTFVDNHPYESYVYGGRSFLSAEGGLTKTWLELGVVGVILYAGVFLSVLGPPLRSLHRLDGAGRALTVLTVALGIVFLKGHASLDDPLVQPLFWLAAGGIWGRSRSRGTGAPTSPRGTGERILADGRVRRLANDIIDEDHKGLASWPHNYVRYAELEAQNRGWPASLPERLRRVRFRDDSDTRPLTRAVLKDIIFPSVPAKPVALLVYMYVVRLGLLGGYAGLRFCFFHACDATVHALQAETVTDEMRGMECVGK